jgi:hypothetical protein
MTSRIALPVAGPSGAAAGGGGLAWQVLRDADREATLDSDPSGLVTSYSQASDGLWTVTFTQTGTARDGYREGWLRRWRIPGYDGTERDQVIAQVWDIDWGGDSSRALIGVGMTNGDTLMSAVGRIAALDDSSSTQARAYRIGETAGTQGNLVDKAASTFFLQQHARPAGTAARMLGGYFQSTYSTTGSDRASEASLTALPGADGCFALFVGSLGTGTLTRTVTFRARWAHVRLPAWS